MKFLKDIEIVSSKLLHNGQEIIDINGKIDWSKIKNTPTLVDPSHNHDALYYRKAESDSRYAQMATTGLVSIPANQSGWYTIARNGNPPNTTGGDRATGYFVIRDVQGSDHQSVHFIASTHYGNASDSEITILNNSSYHETGPFTKIRLITGDTYQGAILQVYVSDYNVNGQVVQAWLSHNLQESGWQLVNWVREDAVPSGMTAREITISDVDFAVGRSDTDKFEVKRGGHITATGNLSAVNIDAKLIRVNNNVVWHNGNMGHGSGLNADMLDGVHADAFLRADTGGQISGTLSAQSVASNDSGTLHLPIVGGGGIATASATVTGAIKIRLPQSWTNTMMQFVVDVFDYASKKSFSVLIAGYNYGPETTWANTSATIIAGATDRNFTVRFGHDGSKCCVYIGELNTVWNCPQIRVRDFIAGYSNYNASNWMTGWVVGFESTAFGTITSTVTNTLAVSSYALDAERLGGVSASSYVQTSRTISAGAGLTGGGALSSNITLSVNFGGNGSATTVARSDHNHDATYVRKTGDTITGDLGLTGWLHNNSHRIRLGSAGWGRSNGETKVLGEIVDSNSTAGNARLMIHSDVGKVNLYIDGDIYADEGQYKVWHAGNDGAGSGLDADLLDGFDSTAFVKKAGDAMTGELHVPLLILTNNNGVDEGGELILKPAGSWTNDSHIDRWQDQIRIWTDGGKLLAIPKTGDLTWDGQKIWTAENDGAGSGLDADLLDGIDSTGFLRRNTDTDTTGKITITRDGDAIVFNKNSGASFSGLLFTSTVNAGSDYAYIRYYDDVSNFYAPYDNGGNSENSALVIGVENDGVNTSNDYLVLRGPTKIILDAFASSGPSERVAEFRRQGTIVSHIDNTGKYNGDVSSNQIEIKSTSTSNKFVIDFNETENSLDFIYT